MKYKVLFDSMPIAFHNVFSSVICVIFHWAIMKTQPQWYTVWRLWFGMDGFAN